MIVSDDTRHFLSTAIRQLPILGPKVLIQLPMFLICISTQELLDTGQTYLYIVLNY